MKITKRQLKRIIREELKSVMTEAEDIKKDPAYKRGRKAGKAGKNKDKGMKAEEALANGSVKKYEQGWLSGHEIAETGGD